MRSWTSSALSFVALVCGAAVASAQASGGGGTGTIVGQVVAVDSRAPLQSARVSVQGTTLAAPTNVEGRYVIRNVPAGSQTVRFDQPLA